jgi:hypothetical protein
LNIVNKHGKGKSMKIQWLQWLHCRYPKSTLCYDRPSTTGDNGLWRPSGRYNRARGKGPWKLYPQVSPWRTSWIPSRDIFSRTKLSTSINKHGTFCALRPPWKTALMRQQRDLLHLT